MRMGITCHVSLSLGRSGLDFFADPQPPITPHAAGMERHKIECETIPRCERARLRICADVCTRTLRGKTDESEHTPHHRRTLRVAMPASTCPPPPPIYGMTGNDPSPLKLCDGLSQGAVGRRMCYLSDVCKCTCGPKGGWRKEAAIRLSSLGDACAQPELMQWTTHSVNAQE